MSDLLAAVLSGRNALTVRAYARDFEDFARFLGAASAGAALDALIALPHGAANATALAYRAHLMDRGLAASTIARRLSALRSAVRLARQLGRVAWSLEVESPKVVGYRDTTGPGAKGWRRVLDLALAEAPASPKGRRDLAMIRLLHDLGLRRGEVVDLDRADLDLERGLVHVLGKGQTARVPLTLPDPARHALADWLATRGDAPGALFSRLDGAGAGDRLTGGGLYRIVGDLGRRARLSRPLRPHGLRHQAITSALDLTGGDVRAVRKFSRHAKLDTLMVYDDSRRDLAGDVAKLISQE